MRTKVIITFILISSFLGIWYYFSTPTSTPVINQISTTSAPPLPGYRFAFVSHPQREFSEEEVQYIATNYDLVVTGLQTNPMAYSARRLKEINPNLKVLVYFPTSIRHQSAQYGQDVFKEEWYLHDFSGNRITKGAGGVLERVDLTNPEYRVWARQTASSFLDQAPFDGFVYDNANPIGITSTDVWTDQLTQTKIDAWNNALRSYLTGITELNNGRNKLVIYNGIHRARRAKVNRTLSQLDITNGTLNERFCWGEDEDGEERVVSKEFQLEDIDLQLQIGNRQKYLLQKVNWGGKLSSLPLNDQKRLGDYCLGLFLLGHVPGYTFFKFGDGYNLNLFPEEYKLNSPSINTPIGNPLESYKNNDWLLTRRYSNGYVIVNLNSTAKSWTTPTILHQYQNGKYTRTLANVSINLPPQSAKFFVIRPSSTSTPPPSGTVSGDLNGDGRVTLADFNYFLPRYGTSYNLSHFNQILSNYGH